MKSIYFAAIVILLNGCGGEGGKTTAINGNKVENQTLKGSCLTNYPSYPKITSSMIMDKNIFDTQTSEKLDMKYIKYNFVSSSKVKKTIIEKGFLDFEKVKPTIVNSSYSIVDGGVLVEGENGKALLFILDAEVSDNAWTVLRQEVVNGVCADGAMPTTWDFEKTAFYPDNL